MSQSLELPDPVFAALQREAAARGITPAAWIAAQLGSSPSTNGANHSRTETMADRFKGRTGIVATGGAGDWSEEIGERFTDHLTDKKQAGHL
jgi:hypothetical protein